MAYKAHLENMRDRIQQKLDYMESVLEKRNYPVLEAITAKNKHIKRSYVVLLVFLLGMVLFVGLTSLRFVSHLLAFVPIYRSFKSLKKPQPNDDQFFITYWMLNGGFTVIEPTLTQTRKLTIVFYCGKMLFLFWAQHPKTKGALVIFRRLLNPLLSSWLYDENHQKNYFSTESERERQRELDRDQEKEREKQSADPLAQIKQ